MSRVPVAMPASPGQFQTRDAVSDARQSALAIRALAAGEYTIANGDFTEDVDAYQEANSLWDQRRGVIQNNSQSDYDSALAAGEAAYAKLGLESASVTLAYGRLGEADNKISQGDMTPPNQQQMKIDLYNQGESKAQDSRNASAAAANHRDTCRSALAAWHVILDQYG